MGLTNRFELIWADGKVFIKLTKNHHIRFLTIIKSCVLCLTYKFARIQEDRPSLYYPSGTFQ